MRIWEERKNKGRRRSERVYCEKGWMSKRKYFFLGQKKIIFIRVMHCVWERLFSNFFFGKQPIENKFYFYFYKSFLLTKDNFLFTNFFLCYQTLEKEKNYLYGKFSNETNRAYISHFDKSRESEKEKVTFIELLLRFFVTYKVNYMLKVNVIKD